MGCRAARFLKRPGSRSHRLTRILVSCFSYLCHPTLQLTLGSVSSTAYVRLCNCLHASLNFIQYLLTNETGFLRNCINYVSQLRRSFFICFHFCSSYMIYFIYIFQIHLFHGNIWTHNWPAPNISGFIAQLVTASHRYRVMVSRVHIPLKSWIVFRFTYAVT